jgi:hypothetical protein
VAPPEQILETRLASPAAAPPLERRFTVGGVVAGTMKAWWRHAPAFTAMSMVVYAPMVAAFVAVFGLFAGRGGVDEGLVTRAGAALVGACLASVALGVVQLGAVTYGTVSTLAGERARLGAMLGAGLRRGLPVAGTGLLVWLATLGGMLLLVVPGVMVMVATAVAIPAAVVERPGVVGAFRRSLELTRGHRWPLLAAGAAIVAILWVLVALTQVAATLAVAALVPREQAAGAYLVASQLGNVLFSALPLVGIAVAYHDLRVAKEGLDTSALARVFE